MLPIHRLHHSPLGGILQPTMTEAIRLLSSHYPPHTHPSSLPPSTDPLLPSSLPVADPFSSPSHFYTTTGHDSFPAPSTYPRNRYAWIHIFPEGRVHQHPHRSMRYFRWGVARLILEADACPDIVPMWIEGTDEILAEDRKGPRWVPRAGKKVGVWIGEQVQGEEQESQNERRTFGELRRRWKALVARERMRGKLLKPGEGGEEAAPGELESEELRHGKEAMQLRMECALEVRKLVVTIRRDRGLADEDPKAGRADTWKEEGSQEEGRMKDGSWVRDAT